MQKDRNKPNWRDRWYHIVFYADSRQGRLFDLVLLVLITVSVFVVMLDSVKSLHDNYKEIFLFLEWLFTVVFTFEYIFRIIISRKPAKYIFSFYGIIDLISIVPTYFSLVLTGGQYLLTIRILRMLRIFRILKLTRFMSASEILVTSIRHSSYKIIVFFEVLITTVIIMGSVMYIIEGPENGFTSIPTSIYWAVITLTTVGFGDITPVTALGQFVAAFIMILGYSIIAVPTGIITAEITKAGRKRDKSKVCSVCKTKNHDADAKYCKYCGEPLDKAD
ncbi:MAG TPA: ion transporter [Bacteroidales bacterium]|nr:ion transporter [Bacteroidales bacterium]